MAFSHNQELEAYRICKNRPHRLIFQRLKAMFIYFVGHLNRAARMDEIINLLALVDS
jgi:hypothetical protein